MTIAEGVAALTSVRSIYEIARDVRNSSDPEKIRIAAAQMFDLALAAREQTAALQEERNAAMTELAALKTKIEKTERFDKEAENYTLVRNPTGATVYREKDSTGAQGKSPYYCPNCFSNKKLVILNPVDTNDHFPKCIHYCPACKASIPLYRLRP